MNEKRKSTYLFEADFYDYIYTTEKQKQKNILSAIYIETIKIAVSILITLIISYFGKKYSTDDINVTIIAIIASSLLYIVLQVIMLTSKTLYDTFYNKRSRVEVIKTNKILFNKINYNYLLEVEGIVNQIVTAEDLSKDMYVNLLKKALTCLKKSKVIFNDIIPYAEAREKSTREKANAQYLSHLGYPDLYMFLEKTDKTLNELSELADIHLEDNLKDLTKKDISELSSDFNYHVKRITNLERLYNETIQSE